MSPGPLARLLVGGPLTPQEVRATFDRLVAVTTTDVERGALLVALAGRARSARELARFAREMRRRAVPFPVPTGDAPVDLCGSGGAPVPSYNVSTLGALVTAAAGVPVVKHGNRSARGVCGSSDLLDALGLPVLTSRAFARATYRRHRVAFLHAPLYHPATAAVAPVRRTLGIPTIFNRLGPLSNPAAVRRQVVGAPDLPTALLFAEALPWLGVRTGITMSSHDGCDEFSPRAPTTAIVFRGHRRVRRMVRPERWLDADDRRGGWGPLPPPAAAEEAERLLAGGGGARRGATLLAAGAAIATAGAARDLGAGIGRAREALDDGRAARLLASLRGIARRFPKGAA